MRSPSSTPSLTFSSDSESDDSTPSREDGHSSLGKRRTDGDEAPVLKRRRYVVVAIPECQMADLTVG